MREEARRRKGGSYATADVERNTLYMIQWGEGSRICGKGQTIAMGGKVPKNAE